MYSYLWHMSACGQVEKLKTLKIQSISPRCERVSSSLCLAACGNVLSKFPYFYTIMNIKAQPSHSTIPSLSHSFGGCNRHSFTTLPF